MAQGAGAGGDGNLYTLMAARRKTFEVGGRIKGMDIVGLGPFCEDHPGFRKLICAAHERGRPVTRTLCVECRREKHLQHGATQRRRDGQHDRECSSLWSAEVDRKIAEFWRKRGIDPCAQSWWRQ